MILRPWESGFFQWENSPWGHACMTFGIHIHSYCEKTEQHSPITCFFQTISCDQYEDAPLIELLLQIIISFLCCAKFQVCISKLGCFLDWGVKLMPVAGIQLAISGGWRITIKAVINNWLINSKLWKQEFVLWWRLFPPASEEIPSRNIIFHLRSRINGLGYYWFTLYVD